MSMLTLSLYRCVRCACAHRANIDVFKPTLPQELFDSFKAYAVGARIVGIGPKPKEHMIAHMVLRHRSAQVRAKCINKDLEDHTWRADRA